MGDKSGNQRIEHFNNGPEGSCTKQAVQGLINGKDFTATCANYDITYQIPHITENFVCLSTLIKRLVHYSYTELVNLLETISCQSDVGKKRVLLDYALFIRQQFVRVLVLAGWSKLSRKISTCIDVVAFLNGQQNCFQNAVTSLRHVRGTMLTARLRNPDIVTAAEVLSTGKFQRLHDREYVEPSPITKEIALHVLYSLTSSLCLRLALHEHIPLQLRHYIIADGRVSFFVKDEFEFSLSIANEEPGSQWFLVNFKWDFKPVGEISSHVFKTIEQFSNAALKDGLSALYDALHHFTLYYKLTIFYQQAQSLINGRWNDSLSVKFGKRLLTIEFWKNRLKKHVIEIGVDRLTSQLNVRWIRDDCYSTFININTARISMSDLLTDIITQHIRLSLVQMSATLPYNCDLHCPDVLHLQLTPKRSVKLTINNISGLFHLSGVGSPALYSSAESKLNSKYANPEIILNKLRSYVYQEEIEMMAKACGWECPKLFAVSSDCVQRTTGSKNVMYFRRSTWSREWYVMGSFTEQIPRWWIVELVAAKESFIFQFSEVIPLVSPRVNYKILKILHEYVTGRIVWGVIHRSLVSQGYTITYINTQSRSSGVNIPVVRVDSGASTLLVRHIGLHGDELRMSVQGRMRKINILASPTFDKNCIFDVGKGRFAILLQVAPGPEIVDKIMLHWQQIVQVSSLVKTVMKLQLRIISVNLNYLTFEYDEGWTLELTLKDGQEKIRLQPQDPNYRTLPFLVRRLKMDSLAGVVERLQACKQLYPTLSFLESHNVFVLCRDVGCFRMLFKEQDIALDCSYRRRSGESTFFITDAALQKSQDFKVAEKCKATWNESSSGVIGLGAGLVCEPSKVASLIQKLHNQILAG